MQKCTFRTDFADEMITKDVKEEGFDFVEKQNKWVLVHDITVSKEKNRLSKPVGDYITIEGFDLMDEHCRSSMEEALLETLIKLGNLKHKQKVLVVGLGNRFLASDCLGPRVLDDIVVTAHLFEQLQYQKDDIKQVACLQPGVMGQTGFESFDIVKAVCDFYKPNLLILIDALATSNIQRLNKVIQVTNTGIQPGSGVGNYRKAFDQRALSVPVLSIGVATVTSIQSIVHDLFDNQEDLPEISQEDNYIVTPKSIDQDMDLLVSILANAINTFTGTL